MRLNYTFLGDNMEQNNKDFKKMFDYVFKLKVLYNNLLKKEKEIKKQIEKVKTVKIDFYKKASKIVFCDDSFNFFVEQLNQFYGKNFKLLTLKTRHIKNFPIIHDLGDLDGYEYEENYKTYCLKILVDEKIYDYVANKIKRLSVENIKKLFKKDDIILVDEGWYNDKIDFMRYYPLRKYNEFKPIFDLSKVFKGYSESEIFWPEKENLYFKNNKKFYSAIFNTIEYINKKEKLSEEEL